ncbi:hypothetical protein K2X30_11440 [bacterium]|nr:hypothetical protein [bacterium]
MKKNIGVWAFLLFTTALVTGCGGTKELPAAPAPAAPSVLDDWRLASLTTSVLRRGSDPVFSLYKDEKLTETGFTEIRYRISPEFNKNLMFLIPDFGDLASSGVADYVAETFFRAGYDVITLPSQYSAHFVREISKTGAVGIARRDAEDMYGVMKSTLARYNAMTKNRVVRPVAVGLGYGGLVLGHVSIFERTAREIGIQKYLLLNPSIHPETTALHILKMSEKVLEWRESRRTAFEKNLGTIYTEFTASDPFLPASMEKLGSLKLAKEESEFLLSSGLTSAFRPIFETIFERIGAEPEGQIKPKCIDKYGCPESGYRETHLIPYWTRIEPTYKDERALAKHTRLDTLCDSIGVNKRVFILHSKDDFYVDPKADFSALQKCMGDRISIQENGGHLGLLWKPEFQQLMIERVGI